MNENNRNTTDSKSWKEKWEELQGFHRAAPILLIALAAFIVVCYCTAENGVLGNAISYVLMGLFSAGAWAIPVMLVIHAIFYADDLEKGRIPSRIIFSSITTVIISMVEYAITFSKNAPDGNPVTYFVEQRAGGFIGSALAYLMVEIFAWWGLIIIAVTVFAIYVAYFYSGSNSTVSKVFYTVLEYIARFLALIERGIVDLFGLCKDFIAEKRQQKIEDKQTELLDDDYFDADNGLASFEIKELGIKETKRPEVFEETPTLHSKVHIKSAVKEAPQEKKETPAEATAPLKETVTPKPRRSIDFSYSFDHLKSEPAKKEEAPREEAPATEKRKTDRTAFGLDECAENVFTKDFDPFDFNAAEKIATRMSSKAPIREKIVPMFGEAVDINDITEEDVRRFNEKEALAKKLAAERAIREQRVREFEERKAALIRQSSSASRPTPTSAPITQEPEAKPTHYTPTFTGYSSHSAKEDIFTVKENKIIERRAAEMASRDEVEKTAEVAKQETSYASTAPAYQTSYTSNATEANTASYAIVSANNSSYNESATPPSYSAATSGDSYDEINNSYKENDIENEASYNVHESIDSSADSFANFDPLDEDEEDFTKTATLVAERSIIEPNPETYASSADEGHSVTYAYESSGHSDRSEISTTYRLTETDKYEDIYSEEENEATYTPECVEPIHTEEDEDDNLEGYEQGDDDGDYDDSEIPPEKQNPDVINQRNLFPFLKEEEKNDETVADYTDTTEDDLDDYSVEEEAYEEEAYEEESYEEEAYEEDEESKSNSDYIESKPLPPAPIEEKKPKPKADYSSYQLPPLDLLIPPDADDYDYTEETLQNATKLIDALASFGVKADTKGVDRGPRITRYEVVPARGVKVNSILSLENDIALTLAAESIRMEAPIPGKSAIGIEIPNVHESIVRLSELVDTAEFRNKKQKTTICLGKDVAGSPVFSDVESLPHLLVAGATGMGKSVCMNACMFSMLYKAKPDEIKFIMIDPKKVEFHRYNGIPHLLIPVVTDNKQAAGALSWAVEEMERRYNLIGSVQVSNIAGYNAVVTERPELGEPLPRIVIVIDEFADLMMSVKDPVEDLVQSLTQKARAAGIHLIVGTQRPDTNVITGTIKSNIPGRISCRVASNVDSRTIIDSAGADKLLPQGDMLYKSGSLKLTRVQGAFVSDAEMERVIAYIKAQGGEADYNEDVMNEIRIAAQKCGKKSGSDDADGDGKNKYDSPLTDDQFLDAVDIALAQGQISTALLQRKLSIGFGKAARFIDHMEGMGIVSPKNGAKPRNVLISREEWIEKYNRVSL